jgi:hypothetical protein
MQTALNLECEKKEEAKEKVDKIVQPLWIVPVNSDDCATDWNYNMHGMDWVCRCNEGQEQSPIDLDHFGNLDRINTYIKDQISNAEFDFQYRQKDELNVIFKNNMLRITVKKNEDDI